MKVAGIVGWHDSGKTTAAKPAVTKVLRSLLSSSALPMAATTVFVKT